MQRLVLVARPLDDANRPTIQLSSNGFLVLIGATEPLTAELIKRGHRIQTYSWDDPIPRPADLAGLVFVAPFAQLTGEPLAQRAFRWLQCAGPALKASARQSGAVLAAITNFGGPFGLDGSAGRSSPDAAGLAGLVKTAGHEWPNVTCRVIDANDDAKVVEELLRAGPVEVGLVNDDAYELVLSNVPQPELTPTLVLPPGALIVVSGGARGITAAAALELAKLYRPTLLLLGRSELPDREDGWLAGLNAENDIKRAIIAHSPGKPTPRAVESECRRILAAREIRDNLAKIRSAGAQVEYRALDIRDSATVEKAITEARRRYGPVCGLIHGAGVLADKRIEEKTIEHFALVYSTKVDGLQSLLAGTSTDPLAFIALFSSSTGRFGRIGQADYAAANEVLNASARALRQTRPDARVVALNWGPWDGGMVGPALKQMFAHENVGVIPIDDGARFLAAELSTPDRPCEVVVLGPAPPMATPALRAVFERELTLDNVPVLQSHIIGERAVWPMALALEWLAHAALHGHPGLHFCGCNRLRVLHPVAVNPDSTTPVKLLAGTAQRASNGWLVPVELNAPRADGKLGPCYRAEIVLADRLPAADPPNQLRDLTPYSLEIDDAYVEHLFHGPEMRALLAIGGCERSGIVATAGRAPPPAAWFEQPLRSQWLAEPLVLDAAFQAMILWCCQERGAASLPCGWQSYQQFVRTFPGDSIEIRCHVNRSNGGVVAADIDFVAAGNLVARIDGYECVVDPNLRAVFRGSRAVRRVAR